MQVQISQAAAAEEHYCHVCYVGGVEAVDIQNAQFAALAEHSCHVCYLGGVKIVHI